MKKAVGWTIFSFALGGALLAVPVGAIFIAKGIYSDTENS